jgi:hypothetical protein
MVLSLFGSISFIPLNLYANDASYLGDGAGIYLVQNEQISMISEVIDIRYQVQKDPRKWMAHCRFRFQNHSKETVKLLMGFPDWHSYSENTSDPWAIKDFSVKIKKNHEILQPKAIHQIIDRHLSKAVHPNTAYQSKTLEPNKTHLYLPILAQGQEVFFEGAWLWEVEFAPLEILEVENHFIFGGFQSNGPISDWIQPSKSPQKINKIPKNWAFWANVINEQKKKKSKQSTQKSMTLEKKQSLILKEMQPSISTQKDHLDYANSAFELIHYILTTGLTWKGREIQDSYISIQIPPNTLAHEWMATPGFKVLKREDHYALSWHFQKFKPDFNLTFVRIFEIFSDDSTYHLPLFNNVAEARAWIKIMKKSKMHPALVQQLYLAHIYEFTQKVDDPQWQAFFDQMPKNQEWKSREIPRAVEDIILALRLYEEELIQTNK